VGLHLQLSCGYTVRFLKIFYDNSSGGLPNKVSHGQSNLSNSSRVVQVIRMIMIACVFMRLLNIPARKELKLTS